MVAVSAWSIGLGLAWAVDAGCTQCPSGDATAYPSAWAKSPLAALESGPENVQPVAADLQLVAVAERRPLDALAVYGQTVQTAIVERPKLVLRRPHDEGVAAGDGDVVQAQIRGGAAADPSPAGGELDDHRLVVVRVGQVPVGGVDP